MVRLCLLTSPMFQFTHPGGVRLQAMLSVVDTTTVSIHAPGRGATICKISLFRLKYSFNSRTREGCDWDKRRGRQGSQGFNSRTREGCDFSKFIKPFSEFTFQFTHPGGVRLRSAGASLLTAGFQFTHPGGVRHKQKMGAFRVSIVSIHAPGRGATAGYGFSNEPK